MSLESRSSDRFGNSISLRDFEGITVVEGLRKEGSGPWSVFNYILEFALQLRKICGKRQSAYPFSVRPTTCTATQAVKYNENL